MTPDTQQLIERAIHTALCQSGARSLINCLTYAADAPRAGQKLRIPPESISKRYFASHSPLGILGHWRSGQILPGDWDLATEDFSRALKFEACRDRFLHGTPWDQTRAIPYGLRRLKTQGKYDGCVTPQDLADRYASLDQLWTKVQRTGRLPFNASRGTTARTGILVHIARDGSILFGNQGFHRLAIAKLAALSDITVVVGVVHRDAVLSGAYRRLLRAYSA